MDKKVTVIGAGNVGATCAHRIWQRDCADVVMVDIVEGPPKGKSADFMHSGSIVRTNASIMGTTDYADTANSDVVVIAVRGKPPEGDPNAPRNPKLTGRASGIVNNRDALTEVSKKALQYSPDCVMVVVTNPVDVMAYLVHKVTDLPKNRVMGMAGVLDTSRLKSYVAAELNVSPNDVNACILGEHGGSMVPIPRLTTVGVVPITDLLPAEKIAEMMEHAVRAAGDVTKYIRPLTPYYAPATAAAHMAEAIVRDSKCVLPVSAYLEGEYGVNGIFLGTPAVIGAGGVERVLEIKLTAEEDASMKASAQSVQGLVDALEELLKS
ncbi:malate dehydrogenase [Chloroflexota bacterium]